MTVEQAIRTRLLSLSAVTDLVGSRITVDIMHEEPTLPAICVTRVSEVRGQHLRGPDGINESRVQVDSVAASKAEVEAVDAAVDGDGLGEQASGLRGWAGSTGSPGLEITAILPIGAQTIYTAQQIRQWKIARDYRVFWRQP